MPKTIYEMDWQELMPESLKGDPDIMAMARAIAEEKMRAAQEIWKTRIWIELNRLPGGILDALAFDLDVRWYSGDFDLETKRRILHGAFETYKTMGTVGAVSKSLGDVYKNAKVREWWQYGGEPYHFKLELDVEHEGTDPERHEQAIGRMKYYQNTRSTLDGIDYIGETGIPATLFAGTRISGVMVNMEKEAKRYGVG